MGDDNTGAESTNVLDTSILNNIKKLLGLPKEEINFDQDIIIHINTALMILKDLGIGPILGFRISDNTAKWADYIKDEDNLDAVKTYIHLKVKIIFDPPLNSTVMKAHEQVLNELEWRLNT